MLKEDVDVGAAVEDGFRAFEDLISESNAKTTKSPAKSAPLNEIQKLILQADLSAKAGDLDSQTAARKAVATGLGCEIEDINEIVAGYGEDAWAIVVLEERIRRAEANPIQKDTTWDRLEYATLTKLVGLVESNKVNAVGELLAIAKVANQAHRHHEKRGAGGGNGMTQNIYVGGPGPENGVLPSGDLGKITLKMSHRTIRQIEGESVRNPGDPKTLDQMKMLDIKEIQRIGDEHGS